MNLLEFEVVMFPFEGPSTFSISGTTMSGKTTWLFKVLKQANVMFNKPVHKILYCYGVWQDMFNEMESALPNISFYKGIPISSQIEDFADGKHNIIVLDDLMIEAVSNAEIGLLFTRGAHHMQLSIIYLNQNMFCQGKYARTIALNCHYIILFQNLRDCSQIQKLGQQLFPGQGHKLLEAYKDSTHEKYGYLVIDISPHTDQHFRLRTEIFPQEITKIFHRDGT